MAVYKLPPAMADFTGTLGNHYHFVNGRIDLGTLSPTEEARVARYLKVNWQVIKEGDESPSEIPMLDRNPNIPTETPQQTVVENLNAPTELTESANDDPQPKVSNYNETPYSASETPQTDTAQGSANYDPSVGDTWTYASGGTVADTQPTEFRGLHDRIRDAVMQMDTEDPSIWTASGLPKIEYLCSLLGTQDITRSDVNAVTESMTRDMLRDKNNG